MVKINAEATCWASAQRVASVKNVELQHLLCLGATSPRRLGLHADSAAQAAHAGARGHDLGASQLGNLCAPLRQLREFAFMFCWVCK